MQLYYGVLPLSQKITTHFITKATSMHNFDIKCHIKQLESGSICLMG